MKILVTGSTGFIGTKLVKKLLEKDHDVTVLTRGKKTQDKKCKTISSDLRESSLSIPDEKFDVVFHLAAITPMEKNKKILKEVNYNGTVNLFNEIKNKTKFFIYASGLGVFGDVGDIVIDENTPLKPHTDYAKIRLETQKYLESNCKKNSIPLTVVYFGEVYGDGGWYADLVVQRLKKGNFRLPKSGKYHRSFVHVDDVVGSIIEIAEKKIYNESFIITDSNPILFSDFINYSADSLRVKHPGSVPTFLAKAVLGGDFVKLLTTSLKTSNKKIANLYDFKYPSYKDGIKSVLSEIK